MSLAIFAHAGVEHESVAEETVHLAQTNAAFPTDLLVGGGTLLALVVFWLLATYIFKLTLPVRIIVVMTVLLVIGVAGYRLAPVTSTIALACGFALALGSLIAQFIPAKHRQDGPPGGS